MKTNALLRVGICVLAGITAASGESVRLPRSATFDVRHELKVLIPEGAKKLHVWFAMPQRDPLQLVRDFKVESPVPHRITTDDHGNEMVFLEMQSPSVKECTVVETFSITRKEQISGVDARNAKPISESDRTRFAEYLSANQHVTMNNEIRRLSREIVAGEQNPVVAARKLYEWVLNNVDYWVKDPAHKKASPVGSTDYCLQTRTGNCTDFHSLWTSLARASGLPTRIVYGSFFKTELDGQDADQSYHCWPEFYVPNIGWVPHDVAVADIFAGDFETNAENEKLVRLTTGDGFRGADKTKIDYYFGNLDERRVTWSRGRDLTLSPKQEAGPVNAMAKAYVEVDGVVHPEKTGWTRKLTFKEIKAVE